MSPPIPQRSDQPPHPRRLHHRDLGLRRAKHLTAWTAAGGLAMSGGLAVLAEHAFSGVRRVSAADSADTEPAVVDTEAPAAVAPVPVPQPTLPALVPLTTAPPETVAPVVIPVDPGLALPTPPTSPPTTAPPVTAAPIVPPTVAPTAPPTAPPTTVAHRRRHRTTVTTGGS